MAYNYEMYDSPYMQEPSSYEPYRVAADSALNALGGSGGGGAAAAAPGMGPMGKVGAAASAIKSAADVIKMPFDIYGAFKDRSEARKRYQNAMDEYWRKAKLEEEDRMREQARQDRQEAYYGGQYSAALEDRFAGGYPGYRAPGGA